ncbi:MAG TPA: ABC transporter permease [Longimicrobiaceae bacterium]|nr:ABC transporter permease [Longimicrobiaceae bacterium]
MRISTLIRDFFADLRRQKLRSALTILGITWGTVAVVTLLAFGVGLGAQMKKNARGIGNGVAILSGGETTVSFRGFPEGRQINLVADDVALLEREVSQIGRISPEYGRWEAVSRGINAATPWVTGIDPVYSEIRNVFPAAGGRFINQLDIQNRRRVAMLGNELKSLLFGDENAVGKEILIGSTPFVVVGVMKEKTQNSSYQSRDQDRVFIPATTYESVYGDRHIARIVYQPTDPELAPDASRRAREVLGQKYRFDPTDEDALNIWDTSENMKMFKYIFMGFNIFLGIVGSFTLVVGGIGVANIMYIVVRERTREIGVRRALGARQKDILAQVLLETVFIVAIGAVAGFLISLGLVTLVGLFPIEEFVGTPTISTPVLTATLTLLSAIALLAGMFPALKASKLDPVECLRYGG